MVKKNKRPTSKLVSTRKVVPHNDSLVLENGVVVFNKKYANQAFKNCGFLLKPMSTK